MKNEHPLHRHECLYGDFFNFMIRANFPIDNQFSHLNLCCYILRTCELSVNLDWDDLFGSVENPNTNQYHHKNFTKDERQIITSGSAYILSCYFYDMTHSLRGVAISVETDASNNFCILIESTSFSNCSVKSTSYVYGAAILIQYANTILHSVCGYRCSSSFHEGFSNIYPGSWGINSAIDCSVACCQASSEYTMYHNGGTINITRINLSNNTSVYTSALYCSPTKSFIEGNKGGCVVSYCSLAHNNASLARCIRFYESQYEYEISHSNIIHNIQDDTSEGLIRSHSKTTIKFACIQENLGSPIFHNTNGGFTFINCSVDENINSVLGTRLNIAQIGSTKFINEIKFIDSGECKAEFNHKCNTFHDYRDPLDETIIKKMYIITVYIPILIPR